MASDGFEAFDGLDDGFGNVSADFSRPASADSGGFVDPETVSGDEYQRDAAGNIKYSDRTGKPLKKRGRRSNGSSGNTGGNSKKNARNNAAVETLSQTLLIVHMGIAAFTRFDGFALDKQEGDTLANSLANVMAEFDIAPDPKFAAVAGLVTTGAMIYGPRVYLYREHTKALKKAAAEKKREAQENNIFAGQFGNV